MTERATTTKARAVSAVVPATYALEGAGFGVYRPFPTQALDLLDPFLLLDEMEPKHHKPGEFKGAPDHPHRGFETVTYLLEGEVEHRDSNGGQGIVSPGGVQWMTAGDGIVHSEMASRRTQTEGGTVHGFQVWVNLPRSQKRAAPRHQTLEANEIPIAHGDGWKARVVAGTILGVTGPTDTYTPIVYAHLTIQPGSDLTIELPADHHAGLYAFGGAGTVANTDLPHRQLAVFEAGAGDLAIEVAATAEAPLEALLLSGQPLDEPVVRYGPFVMNTELEIHQAIDDYNAGRMGRLAAAGTP